MIFFSNAGDWHDWNSGRVRLCDDLDFRRGDLIYLIGESHNDIGCSEYLLTSGGNIHGTIFSLDEEFVYSRRLQHSLGGLIQSAHDVSCRILPRCLDLRCQPHGFNILG
jgi:hypothetical protein